MAGTGPSSLLLQELFSSQDPEFLQTLERVHDSTILAKFASQWAADPRPWARRQIFAYLDRPLDRPGHRPLVKRLFKHAEVKCDDELMAAFLTAFDRLIRRRIAKRYHYDWRTRTSSFTERLVTLPNPRHGVVFSTPTRHYLRRRAWRYFRHMAHQRPADYPSAIAQALLRYDNHDFVPHFAVMDSWGLAHACFGMHETLVFTASNTNVAPNHRLGDLQPAPAFPHLWQKEQSAQVLLDLLASARSHLVRQWALTLLKKHHPSHLAALPAPILLKLLRHEDPLAQQLGAALLELSSAAANFPVRTWLEFLETQDPLALGLITEAMQKHLTADRLDLRQSLDLAMARSTPIARLGLGFLRSKPLQTAAHTAILAQLADLQCPSIATEAAEFAIPLLLARESYQTELFLPFLDSLNADVRQAAWAHLTDLTPAWNDPLLYSRLIETPFDDIRLKLVESLQQRSTLPGLSDPPTALWTTVLLNVHRGGRHKLTALRQISAALVAHPELFEKLLPILAVAMRSVRAPEARQGLAVIVATVDRQPELVPLVHHFLPELNLSPQGVPS